MSCDWRYVWAPLVVGAHAFMCAGIVVLSIALRRKIEDAFRSRR